MQRRSWWCGVLIACGACGASPASPDAPVDDAGIDAAGVATVRVLALNDFHGALDPSGTTGGAAYLAGEIAARRTTGAVVVSAGDLIGGSPLVSGLFHDEPTIEVMNTLGLDVAGVGNHEFDEGNAELQRMQHGGCHPVDGCTPGQTFAGAAFPFLAANVRDTTTGTTIFPPYVVREVDGVKVAFIGVTLEGTPAVTLPSAIPELAFADEVDTVRALLPELHAAGAQLIVVLLHEGGGQAGGFDACAGLVGPVVAIATALDGEVAMIASGHTHAAYNCTIGSVVVTSAGANGVLLTDASFQVDRGTGAVLGHDVHNIPITTAAAPVPAVATIVAHYDTLAAPLGNKQVGTITADLSNATSGAGESTMGDVITDAMLAGTASAGAEIALMNTGGIRASLAYAASPPEVTDGVVRYVEAFQVQPFSNTVATVSLTGADVVAALDAWGAAGKPLQVAGLTYTWRFAAPGTSVTAADVSVGGVALDPSKSYRVTVNSIVRSPTTTPSMANATAEVGAGVDLDLLVEYMSAHAPVAPPPIGRVTLGT
jgi:5'-nucleotidase